jgi:hypothetical protein
MRHL